MEGDLIKINHWLKPFSWLYGMGVGLRNWLFDWSILKSESFDIPIICVGNITVGGTGKTPQVEYLIRLLSQQHQVAVLSRGYKRKSHGYVLSTTDSTVEEIGDEPWQIKQKFPKVYVAVDANRKRGIKRLCNDPETQDVDVILLDDAFQHRYVKPGINMLLIDYHRMITDDSLLPAGRLRERASGRKRADMVVVTKCPPEIQPMGFRVIQHALKLQPHQPLFFSTIRYGALRQVFGEQEMSLQTLRNRDMHTLLLTGIGSPKQMEQDLHPYLPNTQSLHFPDHHFYGPEDVERINTIYRQMHQPRLVITTEKDACRLRITPGLDQELTERLFMLPIQADIIRNETTTFNEKITSYVRKNSRNSILAKR